MKFDELKKILKRLYKEHINRYLNRILLSLFLSLIVSGSTSSIAWLLDPAVKKIFIEKLSLFFVTCCPLSNRSFLQGTVYTVRSDS